MPGIGVLLALRDKNLNSTISSIYLLPTIQFQKLISIIHNYAPDL